MVLHTPQQRLVIWIIWASLFAAVIFYQFALGHGIPKGDNAPGAPLNFAVVLSLGQICAASVVRWLLLPRAKNPGQLLVFLIIGLALSEAVEFFGLFLVPADQPSTKLALWLLSLASVLQFIPLYAKTEAAAEDGVRGR